MPLAKCFVRCCAALFVAAVIGSLAAHSVAQEPTSDQNPPNAPSTVTGERGPTRTEQRPVAFFTMLRKKSIVFPDIATTTGRLPVAEKFKLFVNNSVSLATLVRSGAVSGFSQAANSPEGYGQGGDGYGKRVGATMARNASENFFGTFLLASLLRQDPRFFAQADPTFSGSMKYAAQRVFITRDDSGNDTINWSGLGGRLFSEALANSYWPEGERTAGATSQRFGLDLVGYFAGNLLRNYWPVILKDVHLAGRPQVTSGR